MRPWDKTGVHASFLTLTDGFHLTSPHCSVVTRHIFKTEQKKHKVLLICAFAGMYFANMNSVEWVDP